MKIRSILFSILLICIGIAGIFTFFDTKASWTLLLLGIVLILAGMARFFPSPSLRRFVNLLLGVCALLLFLLEEKAGFRWLYLPAGICLIADSVLCWIKQPRSK